MSNPDYKQTLEQLRRRFNQLRDQRHAMKDEMVGLIKTIEGLAALCGEAPNIVPPIEVMEADAGKLMAESWLKYMPFVDALRTALRLIYPNAFTTSEIRELLRRVGYPIDEKSDPMVSLNVSLKRLREGGEVEAVSKNMRKAYKWAFKNELTPPPGYIVAQKVDWGALVREADGKGDEVADDHPLNRLRRTLPPLSEK